MRIVHLCKSFSKLSETFIYDYVTELERQGTENHVLTHRRANEETRPFDRVTLIPRPSVWHPRRIGYRLLEWTPLRHRYTSFWALLRPKLKEELKRIQPDVIHAHFGRPGAMVAPVARELGIPLVVTFYGYDISKLPRQQRWQRAYERMWPHVSAFTVLSGEMQERAIEHGCPPEKLYVIHLARRLEAFPYRPPSGAVRELVSVGRLTEKKGHCDAIEALRRVVADGADLRLQIIGEGSLRGELEVCVQERDLMGRVELRGGLPNEEVAQALQKADAFILCSKTAPSGDREGTPTVLIEAQAVGLPCISTRHAGIPEMIPSENQEWLAEEGNVEDIADCLRRLVNASPEKRQAVAERGRAKVEADFSLPREVEKLRSMYADIAELSAA